MVLQQPLDRARHRVLEHLLNRCRRVFSAGAQGERAELKRTAASNS
jgi:hypothetical protein